MKDLIVYLSALALPVIMILLVLAINLGFYWIIASGIGSGVKAISNNCGQTYVVDKVIQTNWFCTEGK
jgi:hypothetical protein